jgi:cytochrome c oxidase subunit 4
MSDHAPAPSTGHELEQSKFGLYVEIAMLLAVITGLELVTVYLPFMFVIFYFMHLRWDKAFCTILFFIGLVLAGGTMWALLKLFGADASKPVPLTMMDPPAAIFRVS